LRTFFNARNIAYIPPLKKRSRLAGKQKSSLRSLDLRISPKDAALTAPVSAKYKPPEEKKHGTDRYPDFQDAAGHQLQEVWRRHLSGLRYELGVGQG
jgi:hypothetical protein